MSKPKFKVGDMVMLAGCPYDEQLADDAMKYAAVKSSKSKVIRVHWLTGAGWQVMTRVHGDLHQDWYKKAGR
jgi:hypothetical protein